MVIPPWADRIEVGQTGSWLVVTGTGTSFQPLPNEDNIEWDRDMLRGFDAGRRRPRDESRLAPHLLFARAQTSIQQVEFVREFGPILATKVSYGSDPDILIARQDLAILSLEQKLFSRFFDLIRSLRVLKEWEKLVPEAARKYEQHYSLIAQGNLSALEKDRLLLMQMDFDEYLLKLGEFKPGLLDEIETVRGLVVEIQEQIDSYPEETIWDLEGDLANIPKPFSWKNQVGLGSLCSNERLSRDISTNVILLANLLLCRTFNQTPLTLHYGGGVIQDLPEATPFGIRTVLYYMLRMEYLYQRELKLCARHNCGFYFAPDRSNVLYCSDICENADKSRRHRTRAKSAAHG
jgi:hypothetical protein